MTYQSGSGVWVVPCLMLVAACGSSPPPAAQPATHGASGGEAAHHGGGGHHAPTLPAGPVAEMQDVLRPLAHGNTGPDRDARICAQAETLRQRVAAVVAAPVPAAAQSHADAWRDGTVTLSRQADALVAECSGSSRAAVFPRLEELHVTFHGLTENLSP